MPHELRSIPGTHMVGGANQAQKLTSDLCTCAVVTHTHMNVIKTNLRGKKAGKKQAGEVIHCSQLSGTCQMMQD